MNRQRLSGFSLMEMMVVLLIVSIVAAASAPMVNRKMVADAVGGCKWGEGNNIIFYNGNRENRAVAIGTNDAPDIRPRLHIATDNAHPHIRLTDNTNLAAPTAVNLHYANGSTIFTDQAPTQADSVVIGRGANSIQANSIAIGNNAVVGRVGAAAAVANSIVIGAGSTTTDENSIVIGAGTPTGSDNTARAAENSIAIGTGAVAGTSDFPRGGTVVIGYNTSADNASVAIGNNAATRSLGVAIGSDTIGINGSVAIGSSAAARGSDSVAIKGDVIEDTIGGITIGGTVLAGANQAIAIGQSSQAHGENAVALGLDSHAARQSIALGATALAGFHNRAGGAFGDASVALGQGARAGTDSVALGSGSVASSRDTASNTVEGATALGSQAHAFASNSVAVGLGATANDESSIALGAGASASTREDSAGVALGSRAITEQGGVAIGDTAFAAGANSIAIGGTGKLGIFTDAKTYWTYKKATRANGLQPNFIAQGKTYTYPGPRKTPEYYYNNNKAFRRYVKWKTDWDKDDSTELFYAWASYVNAGNDLPLIDYIEEHIEGATNNEGSSTLDGATASGISSIAIGVGAQASHTNSVALGTNAQATAANQIVLGTADTTVYIPGNLVVDKNVYLGRSGYKTSIYGTGEVSGTRTLCWRENYQAGHHSAANTASFVGDIDDAYSDRRLKNVGEVFKAGLEEIKKLELFHYTYKKDESKTPHVGVMAQDLMKIFPDAVWKGEDGFYRIRMEDMFYALVNAVKELDAKIEALKNNEIAELRKENKEMHKLIEALQKQNEKIVEQNEKLEKRINALERKVK